MRDFSKWTQAQRDAYTSLKTEGLIRNERPCGCFDITVMKIDDHWTSIIVCPCDSCRKGLAEWRPEIFGGN